MKHALLLLFLVLPLTATALVDYSEETPSQAINENRKNAVSKLSSMRSSSSISNKTEKRSPRNESADFSIRGGYQSLGVKTSQGEGKLTMFKSDLHFQTAYDLFLSASHYYATSDSKVLNGDGNTHSGNPTVKLGLNWIKIGGTGTEAGVDLYGGAMIKGASLYASSRTDKIVGIETSKRFYDFALGLGYEFRLTGTPSKIEEVAIGNISRLSAAFGWVVSSDIRFLLEGASYTISPYKDELREARLDHRVSFSSVSPQVHLGLASIVELLLGARFQTKTKGVDDQVVGARLWDLEGLYGNAIFTGLNISM